MSLETSREQEQISASGSQYVKEQLELLRKQLHDLVDNRIDAFMTSLESGKAKEHYREDHPLKMYSYFKGKKPVSVTLPNGETMYIKNWRDVVTVILQDCNNDPFCHARLLELSGKVYGRNRMILGTSPDTMSKPIKVDDNIFFESYFDTEYLLKMMCERILKYVGYDCDSVSIETIDPTMQHISRNCTGVDTHKNGECEEQMDENGLSLSM